jgi:hypothetical protein
VRAAQVVQVVPPFHQCPALHAGRVVPPGHSAFTGHVAQAVPFSHHKGSQEVALKVQLFSFVPFDVQFAVATPLGSTQDEQLVA